MSSHAGEEITKRYSIGHFSRECPNKATIKVEEKTNSFDASDEKNISDASDCNGKTLENIINENETNILVNTDRAIKDNGCKKEGNSSNVELSCTKTIWRKMSEKENVLCPKIDECTSEQGECPTADNLKQIVNIMDCITSTRTMTGSTYKRTAPDSGLSPDNELSDDEDLNVKNNINIDESMVPYYGRHSCKQYIQYTPVKSGNKVWAAATTLGYAVQFYPYAGKDSSYNKDTGLGGSDIMNLVSKLPKVPDSNYHGQLFY
ncbi:unnamed protein product [Lepeophtheirus salmonis]|uniref:(salmon louse) hypothetical protein n=1 Tax=Lepeophtheirus salmonis TaxID=72036 RepID=A0A7R8CWZ2_LEPSM|nr:unnamed protein product [Lepeophtheirus salmonis]CAF2909941.1 unnamed protein product [Lepeophtheirus salmonis]